MDSFLNMIDRKSERRRSDLNCNAREKGVSINEKRILLVDDDERLVDTFRKILQDEGYFVETALTGQEALDKIEVTRFDLAILDIKLPDIWGGEVAARLIEQNDDSSIVFITGLSSFQDCIEELKIGVYDILLKPISPEEMLEVTKEALSTRGRAKYWAGKKPSTRKAVIEYTSKIKKGYDVTIQAISKKYQWNPSVSAIQRNVSNLRKKQLW